MNEQQSDAEQTLFKDAFEFADLGPWGVRVVRGETDGYPAVYIRVIFDDDAQRQEFLTTTVIMENTTDEAL